MACGCGWPAGEPALLAGRESLRSAETAAGELWSGHWERAASGPCWARASTRSSPFSVSCRRWPERFCRIAPAARGLYYGLFSVGVIYLGLGHCPPRRRGNRSALWAAFLTACANCLFYYSRHFFPYDISLCALLGARWLGLGPWSRRNSLWVGVAASLGFLTYNGYWLLGGCVLILHTSWAPAGFAVSGCARSVRGRRWAARSVLVLG